MFLIIILLIFMVPMYLQKRRADKLKNSLNQLQSSLTPGLPVVTTAGLHATVDSVDEASNTVDLRIADGCVATFDLQAVIRVAGAEKMGIDGMTATAHTADQTPADTTDTTDHTEGGGDTASGQTDGHGPQR